ncbi:hypothetical protein ACFONL_10445 [Camelimonas fluminis]|uniref:Uncharacterized protein n=1 Tax=Camelimonas fluminis TaxID=1576911 RepID=A0ABV7UH80_9HYPH|nr:hypothetical protein [Camelimonas fluminis]
MAKTARLSPTLRERGAPDWPTTICDAQIMIPLPEPIIRQVPAKDIPHGGLIKNGCRSRPPRARAFSGKMEPTFREENASIKAIEHLK